MIMVLYGRKKRSGAGTLGHDPRMPYLMIWGYLGWGKIFFE